MDNNIPVYFMHYEQLAKGYIRKEVKTIIDNKIQKEVPIDNVHLIRDDGLVACGSPYWRQMFVRVGKIYFSLAELIKDSKSYFDCFEETMEKYRNECNTLKGFLEFPLKYFTSREHLNFEATTAYKEKMNKILELFSGETKI